jgi:hypothetical protein
VSVGNRDTWSNLPFTPAMTQPLGNHRCRLAGKSRPFL